jgi:hypothetical protein
MIRRLLIRLRIIKPRWDDLSLRERLLMANIRRMW